MWFTAEVELSTGFERWVLGQADKIEVLGPPAVRKQNPEAINDNMRLLPPMSGNFLLKDSLSIIEKLKRYTQVILLRISSSVNKEVLCNRNWLNISVTR